jgi:hypothetical protein
MRAKVSIENETLKNKISFYTKDEKFHTYDLLSESDNDRFYEQIYKHEPLRIRNACLCNFSLQSYRKKYGLDDNAIVEVHFEYIYDCCFQGEKALDFSNCTFYAPDPVAGLMFDDCLFINIEVIFAYCNFNDNEFSMTGCIFYNTSLTFACCKFGNVDIYFRDTRFLESNSELQFDKVDFGETGTLVFTKLTGLNSIVEFYQCMFGQKNICLDQMACPNGQILFFEVETPVVPIDFADSKLFVVIMYKTNINGLLDLRIATAQHIILQECIIRDCVLLGNEGYRNITSYCIKKSNILGKIVIQNKFSKNLFKNQLQYTYDPRDDEFILCSTSSTDKGDQLVMISENYLSSGQSKNADSAYVLSKQYHNWGRVEDAWTDYGAMRRTETYQKSFPKRIGAYLGITAHLFIALIGFLLEKLFLDIFCGNYATKPSKFLFWIIVLISGFAVIYCPYVTSANVNHWGSYLTSILYSGQLFFQMQVQDQLLSNIPTLLQIFEKLVGLAVISLFAVSFTRKVIK